MTYTMSPLNDQTIEFQNMNTRLTPTVLQVYNFGVVHQQNVSDENKYK